MLAKAALQWIGGLKATLRRIANPFHRGARPEGTSSSTAQFDHLRSTVDGQDAYTLYDGSSVPLDLGHGPLDPLSGDPGLLPAAFRIRIARSRDSREEAGALVRRRYLSRGYLVNPATSDPNLFTFVAYDRGELVGTVSLRLGSAEKGLAADELYKPEMDGLRRTGSRICEFTRLAVHARAKSKTVLASLFHTAYLFGHRVRRYEVAVIEVNPRHVVFYRRALGFEAIGPVRHNARVDAPAVLLCVAFKTIADGVGRYAGRPELARLTHLLFPYGFSSKDEEGILARLHAFSEEAASLPVQEHTA